MTLNPSTNEQNPDRQVVNSLPARPLRPGKIDIPQRPVKVDLDVEVEAPEVPSGPRRPGIVPVRADAPLPQVGGSDTVEVAASKPSKGASKKFRMTERDVKILAFLGRYRFATVGQLSRAFDTSETALRNRLPRLEEQGLVSWAWVTQNKPKVWLPTTEGLAAASLQLREPTIKWGQFRHNLGLVDLGIAFEAAGEAVVTEREIRAAAGRYEPSSRLRKAIELSRSQLGLPEIPVDGLTPAEESERLRESFIISMPGRSMGHVPDMVLLRHPYESGASGHIAVELELTRKGLGEWRAILTAYRNSPKYDKVHYFAGSKEIARSLGGVIQGLALDDMVSVSLFEPVDLTGDPLSTGSKEAE